MICECRSYSPCALLEFRGEHFSLNSEELSKGPAEGRRQIKTAIIQHLRKHGTGIFVFDEAQKIAPGILDVSL